MTKQLNLRESVAEAPVKKGNRWRVIVARPGKGSSGTYSEELFRRDAEKLIAPGAQSFINHGSDRNPKDMIGTFPEGGYWSEEDKAVVAELEVFSHWKEFVEEVGPHCGVSIFASGESDEDGNVTQIFEDRLNGADLVARPGLVGSGIAEKLYESALSHSENPPGARQDNTNKETNMELKDLGAKLDSLNDLMTKLVAEKDTAQTAKVQAEADEAAVTSALEAYESAVEEIDKADLFEAQVKELRKAAKAGKDVGPLIESAKTVKESALEAAKTLTENEDASGRILGESTSTFGAWA